MKKWFIVLLSILILGGLGVSFSDKTAASPKITAAPKSAYSGDLQIFYNKREISFSREPQVFGNEVYVPVSELASALGFYVKLESDRYLILYKNNNFVKLDLESSTASVNGKAQELSSGPFYSDQRILAPLLFLVEALHFDAEWDKSTGKLSLTDGSLSNQFDFIDSNNFYKRINVPNLGLRISVPVHWVLLDEKKQIYGYKDDYEYFSLELSQQQVNASDTLERVEKQVERDILNRDSRRTQITKVDKVTATQLDSFAIYSDLTDGKKTYKQVTYLFKQRQTAYILHFKHSKEPDLRQSNAIINTIADSFQINELTIQERDEHYIEFQNYFSLGMKLEPPLYANQTFSDFFTLKGSVQSQIDGFNVKVSKDSQSITFYVPVKNRRFEQKIYLPFGLGKHNIYIEEFDKGRLFSQNEGKSLFEPLITYDENNVLQLSLINISSNNIRYLIPSSRVTSDLEKMSSLAKLLTYKEDTSYKKAKAIYQWIEKNIKFDPSVDQSKLRSPSQVFDNAIGSEEEMAYFYAALLRSIEIPCRIVTGDHADQGHFWNELFVNGKWIVADLGEEFSNGDGITTYFNLNRDEHYYDYKNIKVLEY